MPFSVFSKKKKNKRRKQKRFIELTTEFQSETNPFAINTSAKQTNETKTRKREKNMLKKKLC